MELCQDHVALLGAGLQTSWIGSTRQLVKHLLLEEEIWMGRKSFAQYVICQIGLWGQQGAFQPILDKSAPFRYLLLNLIPFIQDHVQGLGTRTLVSSEETNFSLFSFSSSSSFGWQPKLSSKMKASRRLVVANILQSKITF